MEVAEHAHEDKVSQKQEEDVEPTEKFSHFRSILSQLFATIAFGFLFLEVGMIFGMPTVVIGALQNSENIFTLTKTQASWFGSIIFITQPFGSLISGLIQDWKGRKGCMLAINIPWIVGWILIYWAVSVHELYLAVALMGLGIGVMEAPMFSYIGESIEPHLRGTLSSLAGAMLSLGFMMEYFLGAVLEWRVMIMISSFVPVITFILILLIPDSPVWLASKGRVQDAEESLCWLRGWTSPEHVQIELTTIIDHLEDSRKERVRKMSMKPEYQEILPADSAENQLHIETTTSVVHTLQSFMNSSVQTPLRLIIIYFFISHLVGFTAMRPFYVSIFNRMSLPLTSHWVTVFCGTTQLLGGITCVIVMPKLGKRKLTMVSLIPLILCSSCLGLYTLLNLKSTWAPLTLFGLHSFFYTLGISRVPWVLVSELFPLQARGLGVGVSAASSYIIWFCITKTYLNIEEFLQLPGVFFLYAIIGIVGMVYFYIYLPETEGKTLHEIQLHFIKKEKFPQRSK